MSRQMANQRIQVPVNDGYAAWVEDVAERSGLNKAQCVDQALRAFAAARGFPPPPPRGGRQGRRRKDSGGAPGGES